MNTSADSSRRTGGSGGRDAPAPSSPSPSPFAPAAPPTHVFHAQQQQQQQFKVVYMSHHTTWHIVKRYKNGCTLFNSRVPYYTTVGCAFILVVHHFHTKLKDKKKSTSQKRKVDLRSSIFDRGIFCFSAPPSIPYNGCICFLLWRGGGIRSAFLTPTQNKEKQRSAFGGEIGRLHALREKVGVVFDQLHEQTI